MRYQKYAQRKERCCESNANNKDAVLARAEKIVHDLLGNLKIDNSSKANTDAQNITEPNKWKEKLSYLTEEDIADKADTTAVTELSEKVDTKANQADLESVKRDLTAEIAQKASAEDLNSTKEDLQIKIDTKADNNELQSAKSDIALSKEKLELVDKLLKVDDDTLDELKEIVAYIKQNRSDLESLSTSNIAGLDTALSEKLATSTFESFQSTNTEELNKKANANADNIADNVAEWQTALSIYTKETAKKELGEKVDKEEGKGLSANDFTEELKNKLENFSNLST
ncbi:hypothetical protein ACQ1PF_07830, partial [Ornithobacterium rhinotracheale]